MGDDTITRIFARLDDIAERLTRVETVLKEHEKYTRLIEADIDNLKNSVAMHGERVGDLEQARAGAVSVKEFIGWGVAVVTAIWAVMK